MSVSNDPLARNVDSPHEQFAQQPKYGERKDKRNPPESAGSPHVVRQIGNPVQENEKSEVKGWSKNRGLRSTISIDPHDEQQQEGVRPDRADVAGRFRITPIERRVMKRNEYGAYSGRPGKGAGSIQQHAD